RLELNPHYRLGSAAGALPVRFVIVQDEATAKNLFEQGRLDVLTRVQPYDFERFRQKGWLHTDPFPATYYLSFNVTKAPFQDRAWRRAVAASVRADEIVAALRSGETVARSWIPRGIEGHFDEDLLQNHRARWRQEVAARPA